MDIVNFLIIAVILGLAVWVIQTYTPIPQPIKTVILVAVILLLVLILIRSLVGDVRFPQLR
jgi:hypothetical protein